MKQISPRRYGDTEKKQENEELRDTYQSVANRGAAQRLLRGRMNESSGLAPSCLTRLIGDETVMLDQTQYVTKLFDTPTLSAGGALRS
jgi:hypothetical protein